MEDGLTGRTAAFARHRLGKTKSSRTLKAEYVSIYEQVKALIKPGYLWGNERASSHHCPLSQLSTTLEPVAAQVEI